MINFFIYQPCKINKTKANNKKNQLKVNITVPPLPYISTLIAKLKNV